MIGILRTASYVPHKRRDNIERLSIHDMDRLFLDRKIGITEVARKDENNMASDMCAKAWANFSLTGDAPEPENVDCICVCTQNPDYQIPHVSAIIHGKLGLRKDCAVFDISHGCAGYVYSLSLLKAFMEENGFKIGLLFTCDPYSEIVSGEDRNTDLLFGDAATVTVLSKSFRFSIGKSVYYTDGSMHKALIKRKGEPLFMDGRSIFNFVMGNAPGNVLFCLKKNEIKIEDVDLFLMHQASRFIVDSLAKQLEISKDKIPFEIARYGNTVSSSIPLMLEGAMGRGECKTILLSGYGVGLCIGTTVLRRR